MVARNPRVHLAIILLLLMTACGRGSTPPDQPEVEQPPLAPLTGVPLADVTATGRPVVATKIDNLEAAGPQAGLEAADLVFEEVVEGGITRFLALFHSTVPVRVGPIRSARPEDAAILPAFEPIFFISGARPDVIRLLQDAGMAVREEDGRILRRDPGRRPPHNVFADGRDLFAAATGALPAAKPIDWTFDPLPPPNAVACPPPCAQPPGHALVVEMSPASRAFFRYEADGLYRRLRAGHGPETDREAGGVANVVVLAMQVRPAGCCDPAGNKLISTEVVGSGHALVLRDGQRYVASWSKPAPDHHFAITRPDGTPLPLKPGPTWLLLAPESAVPKAPS
ncbi:MAG: DUF3048 domain-containing protein [Nitriliruptorales bacterium]